jgi:hypothetical protein
MLLYGPRVSGDSYATLCSHVYDSNQDRIRRGLEPVPLCIWGMPGIGKTQTIREFAARRGIGFLQINPAQFEEMGDLTGMPRVIDPGTPDDPADDVTMYVMPEWVQQMHRHGGEGILLLDDVNRADDRILRGIMQLLQDRRMFNWGLPAGWQIFLTANPDGGMFSVTPMDDAILTRMMHATMTFDARAWATWAERSGVDQRGIGFVLAYPELVGQGRTTPRSLTHLFEHMRSIPDLASAVEIVSMLAEGCIEPEAAAAFLAFVRSEASRLPTPAELLAGSLNDRVLPAVQKLVFKGDGQARLDMLSLMLDRLSAHLRARSIPLGDSERESLLELLLWPQLPAEVRRAFVAAHLAHPITAFLSRHRALVDLA